MICTNRLHPFHPTGGDARWGGRETTPQRGGRETTLQRREITPQQGGKPGFPHRRTGSAMVFIAAALVILLGIIGLAIDTALLMHNHASLQSSADAAALIAAAELRDKPYSGEEAARNAVYKSLALGGTGIKLKNIKINSAPAGFAPMKDFFFSNGTRPGYVQVTLIDKSATTFLRVLHSIDADTQISAQAVAGFETVDGGDGPQLFLVR